MEEMRQMVAAVARGAVPAAAPPVIEVTPAAPSFAAIAAEGGAGAAAAALSRGQGQANGPPPPFFTRGRGRQEGGLQVGQQRERSSSAEKRRRMNEQGQYQEQRSYASAGRKQRARPRGPPAPVIKGSSEEFADLAGPVTIWVGKVRPELDEDKVKEVILKCAESCEVGGFIIENVKCLTRDPNPYSKSFKVTVPPRFEEAMVNPKMYLPTWEARTFTRWPSRQPRGPPAPRQEGSSAAPLAGGGEGLAAPLAGGGEGLAAPLAGGGEGTAAPLAGGGDGSDL
jgi:hypothetical protein